MACKILVHWIAQMSMIQMSSVVALPSGLMESLLAEQMPTQTYSLGLCSSECTLQVNNLMGEQSLWQSRRGLAWKFQILAIINIKFTLPEWNPCETLLNAQHHPGGF
jgi:hypothetical protein